MALRYFRFLLSMLLMLAIAGIPGCTPSNSEAQEGRKGSPDLPRLVDVGRGKCIPCKMMAPIFEELKREYDGRLEVVYVDLDKDRSAGSGYKIRVIPTRIFHDTSGKEVFRHEGFFAKEDILKKWKQLGVDL